MPDTAPGEFLAGHYALLAESFRYILVRRESILFVRNLEYVNNVKYICSVKNMNNGQESYSGTAHAEVFYRSNA